MTTHDALGFFFILSGYLGGILLGVYWSSPYAVFVGIGLIALGTWTMIAGTFPWTWF